MSVRTFAVGLVLIGALAAGGTWWWLSRPADARPDSPVWLSGTIEAEEISIASQVGGRIVELAVDKGDEVRAGDVLVQLETDMLDVDLARTEAAVKALQAARDAAYDAWQAALKARDGPQEIDIKIAEVQAQLEAAELQVEAARLSGDEARLKLAETTRDGLQRVLDLLTAMRSEPYAGKARVSQAEMFYRGLEGLLQTALSIQDLLRMQRERMALTAPRDGYVVDRLLSEGEIAAPLAPILVLADLREVTLTTYVPEALYGRIQLGDPVTVTVGGLPGRAFSGAVVYLSPRAEFTPVGAQTGARDRLMYAVEIRLRNPDLALKPGMIADVAFGP